jgi:hypothetical protein
LQAWACGTSCGELSDCAARGGDAGWAAAIMGAKRRLVHDGDQVSSAPL